MTEKHTPSRQEANAHLIAAAPDMLAALERAAPWLGKLLADGGHLACVMPRDAVAALRDAERAIAAAKGAAPPDDAAFEAAFAACRTSDA